MSKPILDLKDIKRSFVQGGHTLEVLRGINLQIHAGEVVALVGSSGAGKSTLLQIAGLLEPPSSGEIWLHGRKVAARKDHQATALRGRDIGFVYQFHHLLPEFTALENILLPQMIGGVGEKGASAKARHLLATLGLASREHHRPSQLSGGEQQRVAILRAIANDPKLLLADEPTGNLDEATSEVVFRELMTLTREKGMAALIATHNPDLAKRMDRIVTLHGGLLI
ncbi:MAG: ABC transporter ATP-binding protein [Holosporales bacterium]